MYADNTLACGDIVASLPDEMKDAIRQGGCKRLSTPAACNPRCLSDFDFVLDGERQQKCRCHMSFMFFLTDGTKPYLSAIMEREMQARA